MKKNYLIKLFLFAVVILFSIQSYAEGKLTAVQFELTTQPVDRLYTHVPLTYNVSDLGNNIFTIQIFHESNCLVTKSVSVDGFGKSEMNEIAKLLITKLKADQSLTISTDELTQILNQH